jgi:hypothetical protein
LEVVQILTDIDLIITKAYISSDGGWFMDGLYMNKFLLDLYLGYVSFVLYEHSIIWLSGLA